MVLMALHACKTPWGTDRAGGSATLPERWSHAGDVVGRMSNGLKVLTFVLAAGTPLVEIAGTVADNLKHGAGEELNRHDLSSNV